VQTHSACSTSEIQNESSVQFNYTVMVNNLIYCSMHPKIQPSTSFCGHIQHVLITDNSYLTNGHMGNIFNVFDSHSFGFHIRDMLPIPTLPSGRPPAVVQSPILFKRDGSASLSMWHVHTFSRITIGLLRRSDRPVIGGDLVGAHAPPG